MFKSNFLFLVNIIPDSDNSSENIEVETDDTELPAEIKARAENVSKNLLPVKSKLRYEKAYNDFLQWRIEKKVNSWSKAVFLAYFSEMAEKKAPSTLCAEYSMVKSVIQAK